MKWDELNVGDRVAYNISQYHTILRFSTVTRTTKTTIIIENGRKFSRYGNELKSPNVLYPVGKLWSVEDAENYLARETERRTTNKAVKDLMEALKKHQTGCGDYSLDAVMVATITELTDRLSH